MNKCKKPRFLYEAGAFVQNGGLCNTGLIKQYLFGYFNIARLFYNTCCKLLVRLLSPEFCLPTSNKHNYPMNLGGICV